jgi:hypothetical protein
MSTALAVVHVVSLGLLGFALAALLARRGDGSPRGGLFVLSLAPGFAFVINGCVTFARLYTGAFGVGAMTGAYVVLAGAACILCARRGLFPREWRPRAGLLSPIVRRLSIVAGTLCVVIWIAFVVNEPEGPADVWQNWNLKARFLWSAGPEWRALFGAGFAVANPSYPILLPLNTVAFFALAGDDSCLVPLAIAACFSLALAGLLWTACAEAGGDGRAALCLLVLTPCFAPYAARQYADLEMSYFFLAGTIALFCALRNARAADFFLAGMWASAAAFTKNEGVPFLAGVGGMALLSGLVACVRGRRMRPVLQALACAAGMATAGWALWIFKTRVAPLALAVGSTPVANMALPPEWPVRMGNICVWIAEALAKPSMWALLPVACAAAWFGGRAPRSPARASAAIACMPLSLVLGAYFAVAVTSPDDAEWLVTGSVGRVIFQVWPGFLFLAAARTIAPIDSAPARGLPSND